MTHAYASFTGNAWIYTILCLNLPVRGISNIQWRDHRINLFAQKKEKKKQMKRAIQYNAHHNIQIHYIMHRLRIASLLFAGDSVLMEPSDLQHSLNWFKTKCEGAGMMMSTSKSAAMVLNRKLDCQLQVVQPQVKEF